MKALLFFSISILFVFISSCTPKTYQPLFPEGHFDTRYDGLLNDGDQILKSRYQYVKVKTKDDTYVKRVYFPETKQITSETTYRTAAFKQKHGISRTWSDNGTPGQSYTYVKGKLSGVVKSYYQDGSFTEDGHYENDLAVGVWYDFDSQKRLLSEKTYKKGIKDGHFIEYDTLGQIINEGIYRADTIFEQSNPSMIDTIQVVETMPYLKGCQHLPQAKRMDPCSEKELLKTIYKYIKYPLKSRRYGVEGRAIIVFVVDNDGEMVNFRILRGLDASISAELARVFDIIKTKLDWKSGTQQGVKVKVQYIVPIMFRLE